MPEFEQGGSYGLPGGREGPQLPPARLRPRPPPGPNYEYEPELLEGSYFSEFLEGAEQLFGSTAAQFGAALLGPAATAYALTDGLTKTEAFHSQSGALLQDIRDHGGFKGNNMPGRRRKRYSRRSRTGGRKRYKRSGYNRTGVGAIKFSRRGEVKYFDYDIGSMNTPTTANTFAIGGYPLTIPIGTGPSERIGRRIFIHSIHFKMRMEATGSASADQDINTVWCFCLDKQSNGSLPAVLDVYKTNDMDGMRNLDNVNRFATVKKLNCHFKKTTVIVGSTPATYVKVNKRVQINLQFKKPIVIDYSASAGIQSETRSNSLFMMHASDSGVANGVTLAGTVRVRYTDV